MQQCNVDQAVFYRIQGDSLIVIVAHVDDLTIATTSTKLMTIVKAALTKHVQITDGGELHWVLGIKVERDRDNRMLSLSQKQYLETIIARYGSTNMKPSTTPMEPGAYLTSVQSPKTAEEFATMRDKPYREAIGSLQYASGGTRPDITYATSVLTRFNDNPGPGHWKAVTKILAYLHGTLDYKLTYGTTDSSLVGYSDADGSMLEDRKAISGSAFIIDGGAVTWSSKKQELVSLSTTESEYVAATHATKEALWLISLIKQIFGHLDLPVTLFNDNQSAIALAKDQQYHARTKHIDIRFHFISFAGSSRKEKSNSFIVLLKTWLPTRLRRHYLVLGSKSSLMR